MTLPDVETGKYRVGEVLRSADEYLTRKTRESARLSSEVLLARVLGCKRTDLYMRFEESIPEDLLAGYRELLHRRGEGEPVAYIVGEKEFFGLPFSVNSSVLIPRPETETVVEECLNRIKEIALDSPRILDVGVGPGTILLSLAHSLPKGVFIGIDVSAEAVETARKNHKSICPAKDVGFYVGNWFEALPGAERPFDVIVSNPPYVRRTDIENLAVEIRNHEPIIALDGGEDGLDAYRAIASGIGRRLAPGGFLALEVGYDQAESVIGIFADSGLVPEVVKDLTGHDRVILFSLVVAP